jgi:hypothetical protein
MILLEPIFDIGVFWTAMRKDIIEIMCNACRKGAYGFHLLGLKKL